MYVILRYFNLSSNIVESLAVRIKHDEFIAIELRSIVVSYT